MKQENQLKQYMQTSALSFGQGNVIAYHVRLKTKTGSHKKLTLIRVSNFLNFYVVYLCFYLKFVKERLLINTPFIYFLSVFKLKIKFQKLFSVLTLFLFVLLIFCFKVVFQCDRQIFLTISNIIKKYEIDAKVSHPILWFICDKSARILCFINYPHFWFLIRALAYWCANVHPLNRHLIAVKLSLKD